MPILPDLVAQAVTPEAMAHRIQTHRMSEVRLALTDAAGVPMTNRAVTICMVRHRFLFGCNAFVLNPADDSDAQRAYQKRFTHIFNFATLGFYWAGYEREPGRPDLELILAQARWLKDHGVRVKGHPLAWRQSVPTWLAGDTETVVRRMNARVTREVSAFAGVIDTWDVFNEVADWAERADGHSNALTEAYQRLGGPALVGQAFAAARSANPHATLLINDYVTGANYAALVRTCLEAGVAIDAIGIQSHMHAGLCGRERTWEILERYRGFDLPLHFTEVTVASGAPRQAEDIHWMGHHDDWPTTPEGEERQAKEVEEFYRLLFSHPAVQAITWWDFSDRHAWMGAPAGLLRADMSPKPAYRALERLIREEWWTPEQVLTTDARGEAAVRGFRGDYELTCDGRVVRFTLDQPGRLVLPLYP